MNFKTFLVSCAVLVSLFAKAQSSCNAGFTYTVSANGQVTFTDTSSGTSGNTIYNWSFGDGQWSGQQNPGTITYAYNGTYNVNLTIQDSAIGCYNGYNQTIAITNASPCNLQAAFTYTVDTSGYVHITNTTANASAYTSYWWQFQGTHDSVGISSSFTIHYTYNGSYRVDLNANNSNGVCSSNFTDTIVVTTSLNCNLVPSFTTSTGSGGLVNFTNTSTGIPAGATTYWDFGYGQSSTATNPSHTFSYNGTYTVTLYISDSTGLCSRNASNTVTVLNAIPCSLQAGYTYTLGANGDVSFTSTSLGIDTSTRYSWNFGNGANMYDSTQYFTYTYPSNGTYYVTLTVYNNFSPCSNSFTDTIVITNSANCIPSVTFSMVKDSVNPGVWSAVANYSSNVTNATWYWGDGTSDVGYSPTHNYASAGMYNICVLVLSACGDSAMACQNDSLYRNSSMISVSVINTNGVGIANHNAPDNAITLFPNPSANGEFSITNIKPGDAIHVTNIYGQEVNADIRKINGTAQVHIAMPGAYTIFINAQGKTTTLKVIIGKE